MIFFFKNLQNIGLKSLKFLTMQFCADSGTILCISSAAKLRLASVLKTFLLRCPSGLKKLPFDPLFSTWVSFTEKNCQSLLIYETFINFQLR